LGSHLVHEILSLVRAVITDAGSQAMVDAAIQVAVAAAAECDSLPEPTTMRENISAFS
jgi:hypothetical protein